MRVWNDTLEMNLYEGLGGEKRNGFYYFKPSVMEKASLKLLITREW